MALVIAGERSGVGKTTVTLSLLASLCRRGGVVQSFKVGPDFIDPMFHRYVTGRPCRNLDVVLTSESYVQGCFSRHSQGCDYALIEGVMGLFDGVGHREGDFPHGQYPDFGSTAHVARLLNVPVLLVIDCSRLSASVAAIAHGYRSFDPRINIAGVVLNRVGSDRHLSLLKNALESLQLPVLGVLRREDNITIRDRHLGLVPIGELPELDSVIQHLADLGDSCFDWSQLLPLLKSSSQSLITNHQSPIPKVRIAVASDRAFNFYYQDNLDLLQKLGAELVFWSPLQDKQLPENIQGLYFGGGFPEVFAAELAEKTNTLKAIKNAILAGMPTIAECGGLMYLCEKVIDFEGKSWPMVGILPTDAQMGNRLTLGYRRAVTLQNSLLLNTGENVFGHEFHRSKLITNSHQPLFDTYRFDCEENTGFEGWSLLPNLHASYIHQHWGESVEIPQRFIQKCLDFELSKHSE
ncbi:MAG TPA: cobyrinate a,c-diamide synthase [Nostocaceae cyanobacterium]|nr:cobyrinate a,c-diamide synthase [Nostocaceae cyanobacterium]